jgi:hypothetical protein
MRTPIVIDARRMLDANEIKKLGLNLTIVGISS